MISVIIPTKNEEAWLPRLLDSLSHNPEIHEIVVADSDSKDRTQAIALARGCRVVGGGHPAVARNRGAEASRGDLLVFADADVVAPRGIVGAAMRTFAEQPNTVALHFAYRAILPTWRSAAVFPIINAYLAVSHRLGVPTGLGSFLVVRREAFMAIGGFDENLAFGEDGDLIRRLHSMGNIEFDSCWRVPVSTRRFETMNAIVLAVAAVVLRRKDRAVETSFATAYWGCSHSCDIAAKEMEQLLMTETPGREPQLSLEGQDCLFQENAVSSAGPL